MSGDLSVLMDWTLRGSAVLVAVAVLGIAVSRARAASRHMLWIVAIGGVLVLPMLTALLPAWRILPGEEATAISMPAGGVVIAERADPLPVSDEIEVAAAAPVDVAWHPSWSGVWMVGACVFMALILVGWARMARLARRSVTPHTDERAARILRTTAVSMAVAEPRLRVTPEGKLIAPVLVGVLRPVIVIPASAMTWEDDRLRVLFAHELAHVARRDIASRWLGALLCAVQWFNPLAWFAAWRAEVESEFACDEAAVTGAGVAPVDYAGQLLAIATEVAGYPRRGGIVSAGMAKRRDLERRLRGVLAAEPGGSGGVFRVCALVAVICCLVMPAAMVAKAHPALPDTELGRGDKAFITTVVIDAGHGGRDTGSRAANGMLEKDRNLRLAELLRAEVEGRGLKVVMTRGDDVFATMGERVAMANRIDDAVFVSLHFNHHRDTEQKGIEVYHPEGRDAALAQRVLGAVVAETGSNGRKVRGVQFGVFKGNRSPSLLIEGGFLSNPVEAKKIADDGYLKKLAKGIADGLRTGEIAERGVGDTELVIESKVTHYDAERGIFTATGDVEARQPAMRINAEELRYDSGGMRLEAKGNVRILIGDDALVGILSADSASLDLQTMAFTISGNSKLIRKGTVLTGDDETTISGKLGSALHGVEGGDVFREIETSGRTTTKLKALGLDEVKPAEPVANDQDVGSQYLKAYMLVDEAEGLERAREYEKALAKLLQAKGMLEAIALGHPDWRKEVVQYRRRKISEAILRADAQVARLQPLPQLLLERYPES